MLPSLWHRHPGVRSGNQLSIGERAADVLKAIFGTWTLLGLIIAGIIAWMTLVHDPGELHLNLGLSFLASVQGVILQIAANRGDRIASEVALHTENTADAIQSLLDENTTLTREVRSLTQAVKDHVETSVK